MTIQLLWQGFALGLAIGMPVVIAFFTGSSLGAGAAGWSRFKSLCGVSWTVGFLGGPILYFWFLQGTLGSWREIGPISALLCLVAQALGARLTNPAYHPDGKNPLGVAVEVVIVAGFSAAAGFVWSILPGGQESGWFFGALLAISVGYIYFVYDDHPKVGVKKDLPLLIVSFVIEAAMLAVVTLVWGFAFSGLSALASFIRQSSLQTWLGPKVFLELLLLFWSALNMFLWWKDKKPKEAEYWGCELP